MNNTFIVTIVGPYSLGIVKSLAHTTHELKGNWIDSKVARLEGYFSALIKVEIDEAQVETLKQNLTKEFPELEFAYQDIEEQDLTTMKTIALELDSEDRPGIIKDIHELLSSLDLILEGMESHRYEVLGMGKTVFSAKLELRVDEDLDTKTLIDELSALAEDMRIHAA